MKGQSKGQFTEAFGASLRVPVGNSYSAVNFLGWKKICVPQIVCNVLEPWNVGKGKKGMWSVLRAFFKGTSGFT